MATPQGWGQQPGMGAFGAAPGMQAQPQQPQQAWGAPPPVAGQPPGMAGFGTPAPGFAQPPQQAAPQQAGAPKMNVNLPYGIKLPINIGGKHMKLKIIGGVILAIAVAVGGVMFKKAKTPKGSLSYSSVGLTSGKVDADAAYLNLAKDATKWKKDAFLWSVNFQAVRADGTVDVGKGAEVVYTSPSASASHAKSVRNDSVRKYALGGSAIKPAKYGWNDVIDGLEAHPEPTCKIKDVVELLKKQGLTGTKTVRITFDPKFADFYAWRVIGSDPKIDALFGWSDCQPIK